MNTLAAVFIAMLVVSTSAEFLFTPPPLMNPLGVQREQPSGRMHASARSPSDVVADIQKIAEATRKAWNVTGLSVGVVVNGTAIFAGGFGLADKAANRAATNQTLYQIASNSKAFTSMLALMLVDDGALDLDRPVRNFLPSFMLTPDDTDHEQTQMLTPRDLMSHRTGLPRHDIAGFTSPTREVLMGRLQYQAMDKPIRYNPGE